MKECLGISDIPPAGWIMLTVFFIIMAVWTWGCTRKDSFPDFK